MSLENSITEMAAAIRMLAESINGAGRSSTRLADQFDALKSDSELRASGKPGAKDQDVAKAQKKVGGDDFGKTEVLTKESQAAELEKAVQQVEADANTTRAISKFELQEALDRAKAEAKKNAGAADTQTSTGAGTAGSAAEPAELDYEKDVKPVLVKLAGAKGKAKMTELVQSFGVAKATELKGAQLGEIVGKANALMAA